MQTNTRFLYEVFSHERRLLVPLFQRPYVWTRETHWEPLWEDVVHVTDRAIAGPKPEPHFLGALVLDAMDVPTGEIETRLIIDGQQRLTTLQLLWQAFHDACQELGATTYVNAAQKFVRNDAHTSTTPTAVFKLWPTNVDQAAFRATMTGGSPSAVKAAADNRRAAGNKLHPAAECYLFFHQAVLHWIEESEVDRAISVRELHETLSRRLRMVVIDLDANDDAQIIFETLNARGTPLLPSDLVKNFLFNRARNEGEDQDALHREHWQFFDSSDNYWRTPFGRGHAQRMRIDIFLQNYLMARKRADVSPSHLYTSFRAYAARAGAESAAQQLSTIHRYADIYHGFDHPKPGSREATFFRNMQLMNSAAVRPFVLELFATAKGTVGEAEVHGVLDDLESFLVRRIICRLSTRSYNLLFVQIFSTLQGDGTLRERVQSFLLGGKRASNRWPDDMEVRRIWLSQPAYEYLQAPRLRMILEAIERRLRHVKTEDLTFPGNLHVEHLLPRDWHEHWPLPNPLPEGISADEAKVRRDTLKHTFGNLSLLTNALNPAVSNLSWQKKRPEILTYAALNLSKQLTAYDEWNETTIQQRGEALFKTFATIWPHPHA